jgi:DNA-binding IclR family transcriptional regulator
MTTEPERTELSGAAPRVAAREPKAIHRALRVLEAVAGIGPGATAKEVSHKLNYPPATTYRLLNLLVQDAYLVRTPDLRGFALGQKVTALASYVEAARPPQAARELLQELRAQVRAGIHLARYQHGHVSLIDMDEFFPAPGADALAAHLTAVLQRALGSQASAGSEGSSEAGDLIQGVETKGHLPSLSALIRDDLGDVVACLTLVAAARDLQPGERERTILCDYARRLAPFLA